MLLSRLAFQPIEPEPDDMHLGLVRLIVGVVLPGTLIVDDAGAYQRYSPALLETEIALHRRETISREVRIYTSRSYSLGVGYYANYEDKENLKLMWRLAEDGRRGISTGRHVNPGARLDLHIRLANKKNGEVLFDDVVEDARIWASGGATCGRCCAMCSCQPVGTSSR